MILDGMIGLLALVAVVAMGVLLARQRTRLSLLEREVGALRSFVLSQPLSAVPQSKLETWREASARAEPETVSETAAPIALPPDVIGAPEEETVAEPAIGPRLPSGPGVEEPPKTLPGRASVDTPRPTLETTLGTRWAVWVGGVALALGGIFLVRYSIEAGWFGPAARVTLAVLFGLVLLAAGEAVRRFDFRLPVPGATGAYIPAILTAAGAFTLFGAVYAAHGLYGFVGPATAFVLLGVIGVGTMLLALLHGQALAGVGLVGSFVTPVLVASEAPDPWTLFGYLAIVLAASVAVARLRIWRALASAAFAGSGLWTLLYLAETQPADAGVVLFIGVVMLAVLAVLWARAGDPSSRVFPSSVAAAFVAIPALAVMVAVGDGTASIRPGTALLLLMTLVAAWRGETLPLLVGAGVAVVLCYLRVGLAGSFSLNLLGEAIEVEGFSVLPQLAALRLPGLALSVVFLALGLWRARALVAAAPATAAIWTACAAIVPLSVAAGCWIAFGNPDIDLTYATATLAVALVLAAGGEAMARAERPTQTGGMAVTFALAGAGACLVLAIHMGAGPATTTILIAAASLAPALATRLRAWPALGWLSVAAAVVVLLRAAVDPTIVGAAALGTTPVFNMLLPLYGIPALAFAACAWQLARTTGGRPRLAMEALAALFALLTAAMLTRHAMHGGLLDGGPPTLAEQSVYTLIALGFGAVLISIDLKSPSSVMRWGSIGLGTLSVAAIVIQHMIVLNPLFTNESTGSIPVVNLLFLGYLLPAAAAGGLAWFARGRRPQWYVTMLALTAAALLFVYATLSVRRLFKGDYIGWWSGLGQVETYAYSALWLAMGVGVLLAGARSGSWALRAASGVLIAMAVAKVFLFDMSNLEGVLRALSFMGLGAVLIGIGLVYQRLLRRASIGPAASATPQ
jgi:uncharacterized membrane protein